MATEVWVSASQKGGVGKTTVAMCIADGLQRDGKKVVLFDADPQATAFKWESRSFNGMPRYPVRVERLSGLSPVEFLEHILKVCDDEVARTNVEFDYVVIDTPPNLKSEDLEAALFVSDKVIVPVKPNRMAIEALEELFMLFENANAFRAANQRPPLSVNLLVNFMQSSRRTNADMVTVLKAAQDKYAKLRGVNSVLLETQLKTLAAFENAPNYRTSVFSLPGSKDARESIQRLVEEAQQAK